MTIASELMSHFTESKRNGECSTMLIDLWEVVAESISLTEDKYSFKVTTDGVCLLLILSNPSNGTHFSFELPSNHLMSWLNGDYPGLIRSDDLNAHIHLSTMDSKFIITVASSKPLSICPICRVMVSKSNVEVLLRLARNVVKY